MKLRLMNDVMDLKKWSFNKHLLFNQLQGLGALGNSALRDVTISECFQITDLGVQKFVSQCKDLERLDISHCTNLTDGSIKSLAFCCRRLTVVNLAGCKLVS